MTEAAKICDLLIPLIVALESKVEGRVRGDLKVDSDGLWLLLWSRDHGRSAKIHMASPRVIESDVYKQTFSPKASIVFDVFDQATKDTA